MFLQAIRRQLSQILLLRLKGIIGINECMLNYYLFILDYTRRARVPPPSDPQLVENMTQTSRRLSDVTNEDDPKTNQNERTFND